MLKLNLDSRFYLRPWALAGCLGGLFLASPSLMAYTLLNLTTNVQPLNGTSGGGDTFPGAVVPFGMIQWSPDESTSTSGGYDYSVASISGFGLDHISGAGCPYGGSFTFMPILLNVTNSPATSSSSGKNAYATGFSHANEIAAPGCYSVLFTNGMKTELTVTPRTGFGRFTYPSASAATLIINAASAAQGIVGSSIQINTNGPGISGWTTEYGFCGHSQPVTLYFYTVFDHPLAGYGVWNGATLTAGGTNATGVNTGGYLSFNLPGGGVVLARTAVSYVSVANAQNNLQVESPATNFTSAGFDVQVNAASNNWNGYLNKIQVSGGSAADAQTFYTMLYHALQAPSVVSDANGQYRGFDGLVHSNSSFAKYEFFSGWDIYRNECQLLALLDPARASDMAQSLVQDAKEGGTMPRWSLPSGDTSVMTGDPATPIIGALYAFGATNFDQASALAAMVQAANHPNLIATNKVYERIAERDYLNLGYVPEGLIGRDGPVSVTLEYCSADFALARFAQSLGDLTNYSLAMNRAQNWRNLYNANSGYPQTRRSDGFWPSGLVNNSDTYDAGYYSVYGARVYIEGTASQYVWMVPFNLNALLNALGGAPAAAARLDTFFTQLNAGTASMYAYMGNEPCSETPWIYHYVGQPYKTSTVVRQIMTQLYSTATGGLPGNDDLGAMSSWYVWAALGLHPEIPGDDVLTINGPLFPQAVIHLTNGDLTITGNGAADNAPYVQSLMVNGAAATKSWVRFGDLASGGTLAFTMGAAANTNWGAGLSSQPPSYADGMNAALAQNYGWGSGLEEGEAPLAWTNTVDVAAYPAGGSNNVGPIESSLTGPELAVRSENSQSASNEVMYSGMALGGASNYVYLKMFALGGSNLAVVSGMHFSYWVFPQSHANNSLATGSNSAYVALDLIFTNGTNLRDSGLTDQRGVGIDPVNQGGILVLDTWNYVTVDLTPLAGLTVSQIDFGFSQPNSSGGFRGYVDDIALTIPAASWFTNDLAASQPASSDGAESGYPAAHGNDGNLGTRWSADDGNTNHWWQVDLGQPCNLTGDEVIWQLNGVVYDYQVEVSSDAVNWTTVVDKTANTSPEQDQLDSFLAVGRYVRISVTGLPSGAWASFDEFRVWGSTVAVPAIPTNLQAKRRYNHTATLNWTASANATSYQVARSNGGSAESIIATPTATAYTDTGLTDDNSYNYMVAAVNLAGASAYSSQTTAPPLIPATGSYAAAVLAASPLAYWPLNETNGSVAYDLIGGYDGTYTGGFTLAQAGIPNGGFGFPGSYSVLLDGSSGYVDVPEGPFNLTNAITATAWVKSPATPAHFSGVVGHGDSSWRMSVNTSGKPGGDDAHVYGDATSASSIVGTNWHLLVYTFTGVPNATNNGLLYVDGLVKATNTVGALSGNPLDVWIGGSPDYGAARLFSGSLAQVAVFAHALSAAQVQSLYQAGTNGLPILTLVSPPGAEQGVALEWSQGTLLQSTNLTGPWTTNASASPIILDPTNAQMFFKLR